MTTQVNHKSSSTATFIKYVATAFSLMVLLAGCQQPEAKVESAKEKVVDANQDLKEARREARAEWQAAWLTLKRDNDKDIADNERRIIDLRKEVNAIDTRYRAKYTTRIDEFEVRNNELRDRVNNARDEGDVSWEQFKKDMKHDEDDLRASLRDITIKNS